MLYIEKEGLPNDINSKIIELSKSEKWKSISEDDTTAIRNAFDNDFPKNLPDCYGYEVEDVLRYRQESVSRPKKVKMLVDEIENAIDDIEFDKADAALERLKNVLGEDNSEYKKMAGCISDAKFIEEC